MRLKKRVTSYKCSPFLQRTVTRTCISSHELGTVPATFAALLSEHVTQVTLKQALQSYETIATNEAYNWPLSAFVPGVLRDFDLPEIYRELTSKRLTQIDPQGAVAKF